MDKSFVHLVCLLINKLRCRNMIQFILLANRCEQLTKIKLELLEKGEDADLTKRDFFENYVDWLWTCFCDILCYTLPALASSAYGISISVMIMPKYLQWYINYDNTLAIFACGTFLLVSYISGILLTLSLIFPQLARRMTGSVVDFPRYASPDVLYAFSGAFFHRFGSLWDCSDPN